MLTSCIIVTVWIMSDSLYYLCREWYCLFLARVIVYDNTWEHCPKIIYVSVLLVSVVLQEVWSLCALMKTLIISTCTHLKDSNVKTVLSPLIARE